MLRAAAAALFLGYAAALVLTALHVVAGTARTLLLAYWPAILVVAGIAGLVRGLGPALYGRWLPAGVLVLGGLLLAGRLAHVPLGQIALAGVLAWAGLAVAFGGAWRHRDLPR